MIQIIWSSFLRNKQIAISMATALFCLFIPFGIQAQTNPVILVMGDSLSAEYGLTRGTGWVRLLENQLQQEASPWTVFNASISGETSSGGLTRLPKLLSQKNHLCWLLIDEVFIILYPPFFLETLAESNKSEIYRKKARSFFYFLLKRFIFFVLFTIALYACVSERTTQHYFDPIIEHTSFPDTGGINRPGF
jgi:hypothetical protein